VCLQLYDIRCNSLTVGGIQLAMILLRTGSLLYQKMLSHGDAHPVRKTEERFLQCSLRGDLQKGRQFCVPASSSTCSWKNPDRIELSSNKFLILLLLIVVDSSISISSQTREEVGHV
jgi:hypothetical protein